MAKILVIHDRPGEADALARHLEGQGHVIVRCDDAWSAAQAANSEQPDLVIIDLDNRTSSRQASTDAPRPDAEPTASHIPAADSDVPNPNEVQDVELCRVLKRIGQARDLRVILIVGNDAEIAAGLRAGADLCIPRPVNCAAVAVPIQSLMRCQAEHRAVRSQNRRLQRQLARRRQAERDLRHRVRFEKLLSTISRRFLQLESGELEPMIVESLAEVGRFVRVERCFLFLFSDDLQTVAEGLEWCAEGLQPAAHRFRGTPTSRWPWWMQQLHNHRTIGLASLNELPSAARIEHEDLHAVNLRSCLAGPVMLGGKLKGYLGFGSIRDNRTWFDEDVSCLRTVSEILVGSLMRKCAEERTRRAVSADTIAGGREVEEALQASQSELAVRHRIAQVFLTSPDEDIYAAVLEMLLDTFDCEHGYFGYIDERGDLICPSLTPDIWDLTRAPNGSRVFPRNRWRGLPGRSLLEKKALYINSSLSVPDSHAVIQKALMAPILHKGELIGQLAVANRKEDFNEADIDVINTVADCVAPVLHARLQKERIARKGHYVENALRENLQLLFNSLDDFLWVLDVRGSILMVNRVVTQRLGYTEGELIGASILTVHPQDIGDEGRTTIQRMLAGEINACALPLLAKDGTVIPVETRVTRGHWQENEAIFALSRDTTERLSAEREVKQYTEALEAANRALEEYYCKAEVANRTKSDFLANMSHELRTPLHGILSFASFGIKKIETATAADLLRYFEQIEKSGKVLLALVNDLLDLAKLESGKMSYNVERVDLYMLVLSAADECSSLASHRNIRIACQKPGRPARVFADQAKIMQVLRNILSNAIKFSPEGGTIDVEMQANERTVAVSVLDRGIGIPEGELEAVFDKFIQSSKTHTGAGGTGLGLAICREIVSAHGGQIRAANRPDGGAVLTFELPLVFKSPEDPSHANAVTATSLANLPPLESWNRHEPETNSHS